MNVLGFLSVKFMSHYHQFDKKLKSLEKQISYHFNNLTFSFITDYGVFSMDHIDHGSNVLLHAIDINDYSHILDVGCGYGVLGCVLKTLYSKANVTMFDVNPRAVALAKKNTAHLEDVVVVESDFVPEGLYDLVVMNPPIRAGKKVIFDLYTQIYRHMTSEGTLYIVISKRHGAPSHQAFLKTMFDEVNRVEKSKGYDVYKAIKY
jgi:16S rRNA (guanine1207-N2)-methyltransferase